MDNALLNCGKFKDAFESLMTWLAETEDTVENQKPASPEVRVVKAQVQEQKVGGSFVCVFSFKKGVVLINKL